MSDTERPLLRVQGLTKIYPATRGRDEVRAVDDVSFTIASGETLGLVGESGSGKTTLGRALLRLIEPTSGRVELSVSDGQPVDLMQLGGRDLRAFRRHAQMIFQDPFASLNPRMRIGDAIAEPLTVHGLATAGDVDDRVRHLVIQVGLDPVLLQKKPGALSGGQRQRVGIARAIATGPRLIVADEPVTALDVSVQAQILNLLRDLQEQLGMSYLFISHDLAVVEQMASRVAVMNDGRLVEMAAMTDLLVNPQHATSRKLVTVARGRQPGRA